MIPVNATTGDPYSGKNGMILLNHALENGYPTAEYLTFKQALAIGRCVRKGEHGTYIVKIVESKNKVDADGKKLKGPRGYAVFNLAQTDELPQQENAQVSA